jgi:hypothetical protein
VRLEGLRKMKNPVTSSGIEPATFRLVALCLNQLCYLVAPGKSVGLIILISSFLDRRREDSGGQHYDYLALYLVTNVFFICSKYFNFPIIIIYPYVMFSLHFEGETSAHSPRV